MPSDALMMSGDGQNVSKKKKNYILFQFYLILAANKNSPEFNIKNNINISFLAKPKKSQSKTRSAR